MEPLQVAEIISALEPGYWRVRHFDEIDSTQRALVAAVQAGRARAGDVFIAEFQSAGRGRGDRTFISEAGDGILLSAVLTPTGQPHNRWGWLPLIVGVAASAAIFDSTGVHTLLKWPNDLMIDEKKVGGIIAERIEDTVVVGIGINCLQREENLPAEGSTSLALHALEEVDRSALVISLLKKIATMISEWESKPAAVENRYRQLCSTLEQQVRLILPDGIEITGRSAAISTTGALILADGREFVAADVTHLRLGK